MNPLNSNSGSNNLGVNSVIQSLADMINFAKTFQSPQAYLEELQRQNPQQAARLTQLAKTIKNPSEYAMQMLAQQGITPEELQKALRRR